MKISIITATWNRADTIRSTIESILNQKYQNWEHIIIDGVSEDNTLEIIKEYESSYNGRLIVISEHDNGIYDAMNKGIALASGDYVGFLNSDDFYCNDNVLKNICDKLNETQSECVYAGAVAVDAKDPTKVLRVKKPTPYPKDGFRSGWHPSHPTFYAKKECYEKFGYYDSSFGTAADLELMMRFIDKYKISMSLLPNIIIKMRFGGASNNSLTALIKANKNSLRAFDKNNIKRPKFYFIRKIGPKFINALLTKFGLIKIPELSI